MARFYMSDREIAALNRKARTVRAGETYLPGHSGKRKYVSLEKAQHPNFRPYKCRHCDGWHRTTKEQ